MKITTRLQRSALAFPVAAVAALVLLLISEASYWRTRNTLDEMTDYYAQSSRIQYVLRLVVDAETGQRGYLLTGHKNYLKPYDDAVEALPGRLADIHGYARERGPEVEASAAQLQHAVEHKLAELTETVRLYDAGDRDAAQQLVASDSGRQYMEQIRELSTGLRREEANLVRRSHDEIRGALLTNRLGIGLTTALCLLALRLYLGQTLALNERDQEQRRELQRERDEMEAEVGRRTEELAELSGHLQTVREDERTRLARELHDELGALLTAAKLDAARIRKRVAGHSPEVAERLAHLDELLNSGIALKRRIIEDLRPSSLSNLGLVSALEHLIDDFRKHSEIQVEASLNKVALGPNSELTVYRLVQEALTNISKYAKAKRVEISLAANSGMVEVAVTDDGVGFDPAMRRTSVHGLIGMRYRVASEGGSFSVRSAPGQGTRLRAAWPIAGPA